MKKYVNIYIPFEGGEYYVAAKLPMPTDVHGNEMYFRVGKWLIRYEKDVSVFEIQGVKSRLSQKVVRKLWRRSRSR